MIHKIHKKIRIAVQLGLSVILTFLLTLPTSAALSDSTLDFYNKNGIYYYNSSGANVSCTSGTSQNYSGADILGEQQMAVLTANQPFYESAAEQYGFPWQIIAAIHYKENSLKRSNPSNGQGAYQLYSYTSGGTNANAFLPAGEISDAEFTRQTEIMAGILNDIANSENLDLNDSGGIKRLFFRYNGIAQKYIDKGIALGFSQEEARNGEGSVYVMNRYDPERDPTNKASMNPAWPGMYVGDGQ